MRVLKFIRQISFKGQLIIALLLMFGQSVFAQSVIIGDMTSPPATTSYFYGPYYRSSSGSVFDYSRYEYLYTSTELGIPPGAIITKISWYKEDGTITGNNVFDIWLDNSTATSLTADTWNNLLGTATQVYASTTQSFTASNDSWEGFTLTTPFIYTGGSLKIFTAHEMTGTPVAGNYYYVNNATGMALGYATSNPIAGTQTLNATSYGNKRPTIKIEYIPGVDDDGGIDSLISPSNGNFCSYENKEIQVRMRNFGANAIDSFQVHWSVNGVLQPPYFYNATSVPNAANPSSNFVNVTIGTYYFPYNQALNFKFWIYHPNGQNDGKNSNDTLSTTIKSEMEGVTVDIRPGDTTICAGKSVILSAGQQPAGCVFIWSNGAITQSTAVSQAGDYSVIVQSPQGCFAYDTVTITENPQLTPGVFGAVDNGGRNFTFTAVGDQNVVNYFWDFGDGQTLSGPSNMQTHHYDLDGTYAVVLKESNRCDTVTLSKQVYVSSTPNGIGDVKGLDALLKVYPNPANDKIFIKTGSKIEKVYIYDVLGKQIDMPPYSRTSDNSLSVDVSAMASGVYQLKVSTKDDGFINKKISVIH